MAARAIEVALLLLLGALGAYGYQFSRVCGTSITNITVFNAGTLASDNVEAMKQHCIRQGGLLATKPFDDCTSFQSHRSQRGPYYVFPDSGHGYIVMCTKPMSLPKTSLQCEDRTTRAYFPTTADGNYILGEKESDDSAMIKMCPVRNSAPTNTKCAGDLMNANADLGTYYYPVMNRPDSASYGILICFKLNCPLLSAPTDGMLRAGSNATTMLYSCNSAYIMSGSAETVCLPSGNWSSSPPTCTLNFNTNDVICADPSELVNEAGKERKHPTPEEQCGASAVTFTQLQPKGCKHRDFEFCLNVVRGPFILAHPRRTSFVTMPFLSALALCNSYDSGLQVNYRWSRVIARDATGFPTVIQYYSRIKLTNVYFANWIKNSPWRHLGVPKFMAVHYNHYTKEKFQRVYYSDQNSFRAGSPKTLAYPVCGRNNSGHLSSPAQRCLRDSEQSGITKPVNGECSSGYIKKTWRQGGLCDLDEFDYCFRDAVTDSSNKFTFSISEGCFINGQPFTAEFDSAKHLCPTLPDATNRHLPQMKILQKELEKFPRMPSLYFWLADGNIFNPALGTSSAAHSRITQRSSAQRAYAVCVSQSP